MGLSIYNIKKWAKMLTGNSIMHVNQDMGKYFVPGEVKGYFNNLTEKVLKDSETLNARTVPISTDETAGNVYFPIAIFQYGLGAYDLYIGTNKKLYFDQFMKCVEWAVNNQEQSGAWNNFGFIQPEAPYSSMCQGEGASLLIRAYKETKELNYLMLARNAIDFMLIPKEEGGTAEYHKNEIKLYEYTNKACVLNGWVFSLFGLYDLALVVKEKKYIDIFEICLKTLRNHLGDYDCGYWSLYDEDRLMTSPFYHNLHIAQMHALFITTNDIVFKKYEDRFVKYKSNCSYRIKAFVIKCIQKIKE